MFFNKKNKKQKKCEFCGYRTDDKYRFCPYCGNTFLDIEKERQNFGLLGRDDNPNIEKEIFHDLRNFGITDKLINTMFNSVMKNLDKQMKEQAELTGKEMDNIEFRGFPNGIRIKIMGPLMEKPARNKKEDAVVNGHHNINVEQIKKMSSLPREKAKTTVKRLGNKVVYELTTPGILSPQDVFVSKLESGYEIKAIGDKKVYVNSIPVNLPLRKYSVIKNKLLVEFVAQNE